MRVVGALGVGLCLLLAAPLAAHAERPASSPCDVMPAGQPGCPDVPVQDPTQVPPGDVTGGGPAVVDLQSYLESLMPAPWAGFVPLQDSGARVYFDLLSRVVPVVSTIATWVQRTYDCAHEQGVASMRALVDGTNSLRGGAVLVVSETELAARLPNIAACVALDALGLDPSGDVTGGGPGGPCVKVLRVPGLTWTDYRADFLVIAAGTEQDICDAFEGHLTVTLGYTVERVL